MRVGRDRAVSVLCLRGGAEEQVGGWSGAAFDHGVAEVWFHWFAGAGEVVERDAGFGVFVWVVVVVGDGAVA